MATAMIIILLRSRGKTLQCSFHQHSIPIHHHEIPALLLALALYTIWKQLLDSAFQCMDVPCTKHSDPSQVSLGESQLDVEAIVTRQRILLKSIPRGMAKVVFTARDFGHFLAHPLFKHAAATAVKVSKLLVFFACLKMFSIAHL